MQANEERLVVGVPLLLMASQELLRRNCVVSSGSLPRPATDTMAPVVEPAGQPARGRAMPRGPLVSSAMRVEAVPS